MGTRLCCEVLSAEIVERKREVEVAAHHVDVDVGVLKAIDCLHVSFTRFDLNSNFTCGGIVWRKK